MGKIREVTLVRVFKLPVWLWVGLACLLILGVALFPVPLASASGTPAAIQMGGFTDRATDVSATMTFNRTSQERGGLAVQEGESHPDVVWKGDGDARVESQVVAYDAKAEVFYQSKTTRFSDGRVLNRSAWVDSDSVVRRLEWSDGMADAEAYQSRYNGSNSTTVEIRDAGPTTTVIIRKSGNFSGYAGRAWFGQVQLKNDLPYVSSGNIVEGNGVRSGSLQLTDEPGVSYEAMFEYVEVNESDTEGIRPLYGDNHAPLIVHVLLPTTEVTGSVNRTAGASGIPEETPEWVEGELTEEQDG